MFSRVPHVGWTNTLSVLDTCRLVGDQDPSLHFLSVSQETAVEDFLVHLGALQYNNMSGQIDGAAIQVAGPMSVNVDLLNGDLDLDAMESTASQSPPAVIPVAIPSSTTSTTLRVLLSGFGARLTLRSSGGPTSMDVQVSGTSARLVAASVLSSPHSSVWSIGAGNHNISNARPLWLRNVSIRTSRMAEGATCLWSVMEQALVQVDGALVAGCPTHVATTAELQFPEQHNAGSTTRAFLFGVRVDGLWSLASPLNEVFGLTVAPAGRVVLSSLSSELAVSGNSQWHGSVEVLSGAKLAVVEPPCASVDLYLTPAHVVAGWEDSSLGVGPDDPPPSRKYAAAVHSQLFNPFVLDPSEFPSLVVSSSSISSSEKESDHLQWSIPKDTPLCDNSEVVISRSTVCWSYSPPSFLPPPSHLCTHCEEVSPFPPCLSLACPFVPRKSLHLLNKEREG